MLLPEVLEGPAHCPFVPVHVSLGHLAQCCPLTSNLHSIVGWPCPLCFLLFRGEEWPPAGAQAQRLGVLAGMGRKGGCPPCLSW